MTRSSRLLDIVQLLRRHRRPVTAEVVSRELEVSLRTVYRDIATLQANRVPIRGEAGVGYVLEPGYDLPPVMFTADEVEAILVGLRWLRARADASLARAADDVEAKIATILPEALKPVLMESSLFAPAMEERIVVENIDVAPVREAIRKGVRVTIDYADAVGAKTSRTIWPFGLAYFDSVRVVLAWCEWRQDFRSFRTDRISRYEIGQKYPARRGDLLKRWKVLTGHTLKV
ncbi:MAG: transcriptional regulator [Rhizobiales bacterium 62-17]|nr:YafY family transcriptional regulator [Hyphomicrobiales bacterium]OJY05824.1 MAG: transcriptional regulator [Rhizobiales bacterium 62-17]